MNKRYVSPFVLIKLLRGKKPFGIMGLIFIIVSVVSLIVMSNIDTKMSEGYEKYDHSAVMQNGTEKEAFITKLEPLANVSVDGENPLVISYDYKEGTRTISDKFQTLDLEKTHNFKLGDAIKVKSYNNESVIVGLKPYGFPIEIFFMGPGMFLLVGSILFLIGFIPALKIYKLYQNGIVREATVFSMYIDNGTPRTNFGKAIIVNYHYLDPRSNKVSGTSYTYDFSIMHEVRPDDKIKIFVSETDESQSVMVPKKLDVKNGWKV